jgi:DNA-binding CsgD family transcriptional regulator
MARSVRHLTETAALLAGRGIDLVVLKQGIDTTTPAGRFTFHVLAAMDEMLADLISEGTREGLESARARGRVGGRKPKLTTRQAQVARGLYDETGADGRRKYTVAEIAETFGVSRKTVYRHLEPSAVRRQPGKSARPAAPAGPLATLPDPAHDRASEPAARPRARPATVGMRSATPIVSTAMAVPPARQRQNRKHAAWSGAAAGPHAWVPIITADDRPGDVTDRAGRADPADY